MAKKTRNFNGEAYRLRASAKLKKQIEGIERVYKKQRYKTKIVKKGKYRASIPIGKGRGKLPPKKMYFLYVSYRKKKK
tara:strand:- start:222 stop:455 length:234 start_codon:yes stop_codon:yes gene_type:complete